VTARPRVVLALSVATFLVLAGAALLLPTHAWELAARNALVRLDGGALSGLLRAIDNAGTWKVILPGTLIAFAVFPHARARWWVWTVALLSAPAAETFFKFAIGRPRPEDVSMGFPSGHATAAAAFFGALIYLVGPLPAGSRRLARALAAVCIGVVAMGRVALGAHWPSDAVAGVALGLALASAAQLMAGMPSIAPPALRRADPEPTRPPS
jgi:membrane-associated phospholipid phosphatase